MYYEAVLVEEGQWRDHETHGKMSSHLLRIRNRNVAARDKESGEAMDRKRVEAH
jgi:hypothetical protein